MRCSETVKEMQCAKTNDQQWSRIVPDFFDVRAAGLQCSSVSRHIPDQSSCDS